MIDVSPIIDNSVLNITGNSVLKELPPCSNLTVCFL